ncbi:AAA family ATPase [Nocardia sp. alder85J]|uniref:AAA family ATPase n=1 Tax=Nocardia sp. alder85J TaxID=2862949 RepID=UPI001CD69E9D|nr:AAA family ATPase [Nocardia sp. alder85J]MCX4096281.1 AAA family ATPase [Nocardia sp. alder85J]
MVNVNRSTLAEHRPVAVAVVGTHSTGKTTFLYALAERLRSQRIEVVIAGDLGLQAMQIGLPILSEHTWISTLWIIARGISNEVEAWLIADVVLIDRAVPDALGYYEAALEYTGRDADPDEIEKLEAMVGAHAYNYDLIFRTVLDPVLPLGSEKPRDTDLKFRALADTHVGKVLSRLGIEHELLPAGGVERAVVETAAFVVGRLTATDQERREWS